MNFDELIDRRGTHSIKWDGMEPRYGVSAADGIPMWVADMDFRPPACVDAALKRMRDWGVYGYFGNDAPYREAIVWWMQTRHRWKVEHEAIFTTHGLVNGTALCVDCFTGAGDGVVLLTPVYHAFARVLKAAGRRIVECPLRLEGGRYQMDFSDWHNRLRGDEKMFILCSPHNPGGRVWTIDELADVARFCEEHDLILVSDEIHHDLVFPGHHHVPMPLAADGILPRLIMMTATTKTFNLAGGHTGNVIIPDPHLRDHFAKHLLGLGISANAFGVHMAMAAYSPEGAEWVDALMHYLDGNRRLFDEGIGAIPGLMSMPLEATYLAWVNFGGSGMEQQEFTNRVQTSARIAANHGPTFGLGGEGFLRFNLATPRSRVAEAVERLHVAFADLQ